MESITLNKKWMINTTNITCCIFAALLFACIIPPGLLTRYALPNRGFHVMQVLTCIGVLIWYISHKYKPNWFLSLVIVWSMWLCLTTLLNHMGILAAIANIVKILGCCFLLDIGFRKYTKSTFAALNLIFCLYILINTITLFLYPDAMYANNRGLWVCWFLGEDNTGFAYYLVGTTFAFIRDFRRHHRIGVYSLLMFACTAFFVLRNDIGTGKMALVVFIVLLLLRHIKALAVIYSYTTCIIVQIVTFFILVIVRRVNFLTYVVEDILHRSLTFTGRTFLWDRVLLSIKEKPLLGHGVYSFDEMGAILHLTGSVNVGSAHNLYLQYIFWGGLIGIGIFLAILFVVSIKGKSSPKDELCVILICDLYAFMFRQQMEFGADLLLYMLLAVIYYQDALRPDGKPVEKRQIFKLKKRDYYVSQAKE